MCMHEFVNECCYVYIDADMHCVAMYVFKCCHSWMINNMYAHQRRHLDNEHLLRDLLETTPYRHHAPEEVRQDHVRFIIGVHYNYLGFNGDLHTKCGHLLYCQALV